MIAHSLLSETDIAFVSGLVKRAGETAIRMREGVSIKEKTGPADMVTAADCELSRLLVGELSARFPDDEIVSEEDEHHSPHGSSSRVWLVDPIDGTENYICNDGQYSVMVGLLVDGKPSFGWVYAPAWKVLYLGGPGCGAFRQELNGEAVPFKRLGRIELASVARVIMGGRDRKSHPWVMELPQVQIVKCGSIGLKVAKVLEDAADFYVHLAGRLKTWDTAGPIAIALGGSLEVGPITEGEIVFPKNSVKLESSVIIGRPGCLEWSRAYIAKAPEHNQST
ncbi:MAG TPA: inositol monophosphatase family protein [Candidatus Obscuribacterales bacterium]